MTQATMPDQITFRGGGSAVSGAAADDAHLAAAVQSLEARNALLSGAVAALTAPGDLAGALFEEALTAPAAQQWPFDLARVQLLYGERLRRARETTRSRHHLQAALAVFDCLGASAWAERAAAELAATAPTRQRPEPGNADDLTAQERQVAELAAAGLSNKQIAARLYMSHRTVGSHLYRVFPKLGISSRAALRDALSRPPRHAAQLGKRKSTFPFGVNPKLIFRFAQ
jgi:DNA-binding CsgD family transcriptional regulator